MIPSLISSTLQLPAVLEAATRALFGFLCHQNAESLFQIGGHSVWLCPRCIGIHGGFFLAAAGVMVARLRFSLPPAMRSAFLLLASGTAVHWMLSAEGIVSTNSAVRLITGVASGAAGGVLFSEYRLRRCRRTPGAGGANRTRILRATPVGIAIAPILLFQQPHMVVAGLLLIAVTANAWMIASTATRILTANIPVAHSRIKEHPNETHRG